MLRDITYKAQTGQRILINGSHWVVYKKATKQECEWEYSHVMVSILVKPTYSLRINHEHIDFSSTLGVSNQWLSPDP